ncbi:MAG: aminotransferase class V-fold PLP-dependent enzyme [Terrimicrobiaceae bacterium]|nr:aminotransferase class V-fold PLP-dependent enzyme [Terrimicrobiaceae bacterium]
MSLFASEDERLREFPVARERIFLAHAGVTVLPRRAADAMCAHATASCEHHQEFGNVLRDVNRTRVTCAQLIGAGADEVALLGPTSLGLSLFANGLDWRPGDELVFYGDDYPANVYPWTALARLGIVLRRLEPDVLGRITPELVESVLNDRTRLVALASCHFLTGWRIDVDAIGAMLRRRGVLFSLDAIQTLGAAPTSVANVDFLSADAHKWMLGPLAIGIVYVKRENFGICRPTLLGAWNVRSPDFLAQEEIVFEETARRYEPGVLNVTGIYGMKASLDMLLGFGIERVQSAVLDVRDHLEGRLRAMGFEFLSPSADEPLRSGILTARHPGVPSADLFQRLEAASITASLRSSRDGRAWIRFSPHFYNTRAEMDRVVEVLGGMA